MADDNRPTASNSLSSKAIRNFLILLAILLGFALFTSIRLAMSFSCDGGNSLSSVFILGVFPVLLLVGGAFGLAISIRRWIRTGSFAASPEEIEARRVRYQATVGFGKPLLPQLGFWAFPAVLTLGLIYAECLVGMLVKMFARVSWQAVAVELFLGLFLLIFFGWVLVIAVRRRWKTGSCWPSEEEWRAVQTRPISRRRRVLMTLAFLFAPIVFTGSAIVSPGRGGLPWVTAAIWWWFAGMMIWRHVRSGASSGPLNAASGEPRQKAESPGDPS
jgi:hypothetical protein